MISFKAGDIITFRYSKLGAHDPMPVVLVIAPLFNNLVHGINIKYLRPGTERRLLVAILDEEFRKQPIVANELNRFPFLKRTIENSDIQNALKIPQAFYYNYIKQIVVSDAYRTYNPALMGAVRIITNKQV